MWKFNKNSKATIRALNYTPVIHYIDISKYKDSDPVNLCDKPFGKYATITDGPHKGSQVYISAKLVEKIKNAFI